MTRYPGKTFTLCALSAGLLLPAAACRPRAFNSGVSTQLSSTVPENAETVPCDVIIAGGSTASLAAGIAAAMEGAVTCLVEPTNWPGGQLTAEGVSAIDYPHHHISEAQGSTIYDVGKLGTDARNRNKTFHDMVDQVKGTKGDTCWVSDYCYEPKKLLTQQIFPLINQYAKRQANGGQLKVYYSSVIKRVATKKRNIEAVEIIQRSPTQGSGYSRHLSEAIDDWYSRKDSNYFRKKVLWLTGKNEQNPPVVIEASEFGDVLALSGASFLQGAEWQLDGLEYKNGSDTCGMVMVFPYVMEYLNQAAKDDTPPGKAYSKILAKSGEENASAIQKYKNLQMIWTYRRLRTRSSGYSSWSDLKSGDLSMANWNPGNDYFNRYIFKSVADVKAELKDWKGGIDKQALHEAEQHALASYQWFKANVSIRAAAAIKEIEEEKQHAKQNNKKSPERKTPEGKSEQVLLNKTALGTDTGLSKIPYMRDSRRSIGIDDFRIRYADISCFTEDQIEKHMTKEKLLTDADRFWIHEVGNSKKTIYLCRLYGTVFPDSLGIGSYVIDLRVTKPYCDGKTEYILKNPGYQTTPFYVPFRAMTNRDFDNLLAAGKNMSQSFLVNAGARLHPIEWTSGTGAGVAAALMAKEKWTSRQAYDNVKDIQRSVKKYQPIGWTIGGKTYEP